MRFQFFLLKTIKIGGEMIKNRVFASVPKSPSQMG
jgi:hypothetical protein